MPRLARPIDWKDLFQRIAALPIIKSHFAWGPMNSFVLLAGTGVTAALLLRQGNLPREIATATGIAALLLVASLHLGRRWDQLLGGVLLVAIALKLLFPATT